MDNGLKTIEEGLRTLFYAPDTAYMNDVDRRAQDVYRRLVRGNVFKVVRMAVPILRDLLGDAAVDVEITRWLESTPPTSKLLRMLPEEFAAWMIAQCATQPESVAHPAMGELVHWETLELGILHAPNDDDTHPLRPDPEGYIAASNSARLCAFTYPVHRMKKGDPWPDALAAPILVLGFRTGEALDWVELPPLIGQVMILVAQGNTLNAAVNAVAQASGAAPDHGFVRSWLVDLQVRGAIVGFPLFIEEELGEGVSE